MKNKLKIALLIVFAGMTMFAFQSCEKYPEGPSISLRSRTHRVANTWRVENYKLNGTDLTSLVSGYYETFSKDGNYSYNWGILSGTGKWEFQNKDEEIKLNGIDNQESNTLYILKLEEKEFWYYYMDGNDRSEFHMVEK